MEELETKTNELLNGVASCNDALNGFLTKGKKPEVSSPILCYLISSL